MNSVGRLDYIDIAKGIGISLVVLGHTTITISGGIGKFVHDFLYLFHMPLFFLISGYLYNHKREQTLWSYSKRKLYSLAIPFLFFWIVPSLYQIFVNGEPYSYLYRWIFLEQFDCWAIWFLYSLLIVSVLYKAFYESIQKVSVWWVLLGGLILFTSFKLHFKALLDTTAFCLIYYYIGNQCRIRKLAVKKSAIGIVCVFLLIFAKNYRDYRTFIYVNYRGFWFGNNDFVSTIVFALLGSLMVIWISQYFACYKIPSRMFSYLGRNSIIVVCTHVQIMQMVQKQFPNMNWLGEFLLVIVLYYCGLIFIGRKYLPFIFGMRNNAKRQTDTAGKVA